MALAFITEFRNNRGLGNENLRYCAISISREQQEHRGQGFGVEQFYPGVHFAFSIYPPTICTVYRTRMYVSM